LEKPPTVVTDDSELTHMTFRAKPSKGRARLSFLNLENLVLEFIQPIDGQSIWQDFLAGEGKVFRAWLNSVIFPSIVQEKEALSWGS